MKAVQTETKDEPAAPPSPDEKHFISCKAESFDALVKAAKLSIVDSRIHAKSFEVGGHGYGVCVQLVRLPHKSGVYYKHDAAEQALIKRGYELPKSIKLLLAFAASCPEKVKPYWVVCPGVTYADDSGTYGVYLTSINGSTYVNLNNLELGWGSHCRFLVLAAADDPAKSKKKSKKAQSEGPEEASADA